MSLNVSTQDAHRLNVNIKPAHLDSSNITQYVLSPDLVDLPQQGAPEPETENNDLQFSWSNEPSFSFTVVRKSTGDVLYDTRGSVLVYENQFIEFVTQLPKNYNLYGMGERIHDLKLGNNFTATFYAADAADPIDGKSHLPGHTATVTNNIIKETSMVTIRFIWTPDTTRLTRRLETTP